MTKFIPAALLACSLLAPPALAQHEAPSFLYYRIFGLMHEGEFVDARKEFQSEARGAIKNGLSLWIDSICYQAMLGESYFHMGQNTKALEHYTSALKLYLAYPDWMIRVQFSAVTPAGQGAFRPILWGQSKRRFRLGQFPSRDLIAQGQINNNNVIRQGGVVRSPILYSINAHEIVRCTALAIRRRRDLLGPAGEHDALAAELIAAFTQRPAPPNNWSQAYIDLQLGMAYSALHKNAQAKSALQKALVAQGEFDHPLTSTVLLELGRLALLEGDTQTAANHFEEATYTAVHFEDPGVLEEAFRYGFITHLASNQKGAYPPLIQAMGWARVKDLRFLSASLFLMAAENEAVSGNSGSASTYLANARAVIGNRAMGAGAIGARQNYLQALVQYQQGRLDAGDAALAAALAYQQGSGQREGGSLWLFHIGKADNLYSTSQVSERVALDLYASVLREPQAADWASDPLECLTTLATPHPGPMERWFKVALARKEIDSAIEIADLARRHQFFSMLPVGGRLLGLRWVLEAPPETLDKACELQRQNLTLRYPKWTALSQEAQRISAELEKMPAVSENAAQYSAQSQKLAELAKACQAQELLLREIAVRREPCDMAFPPRRSAREIRESLAPGQVALIFFSTRTQVHAFLLSNDQDRTEITWSPGQPARVHAQVATLMRELGNFEANSELKLEQLKDEKWKKTAQALAGALLNKDKAPLPQGVEEVIVVPDGPIWYVPFEALQVPEGDRHVSLISKARVRYTPFASLITPDGRGRRRTGIVGTALGRLFPRNDPAVAQTAFAAISQQVPGLQALPNRLPATAAVYSSQLRGLLVLDDLAMGDAGPLGWAPLPMDRGPGSGTLGNWLSLPWNGPEEVLLPGFHSHAESALKGQSATSAGSELFLSVSALMASGARTILISRWRTGGQSAYDLMREFLHELPHTTAADAWQRSIQVAISTPITADLEPRLKIAVNETPPPAEHPFFWAGYLLVDTGTSPKTDDHVPPAAAADEPKPPAAVDVPPADPQPAEAKAAPADTSAEPKVQDPSER